MLTTSMRVKYDGKWLSIYQLSKITACPLTSLYRAYHDGIHDGEELVKEVRKNLVEYNGEFMSTHKLSEISGSDYRKVRRRINAGLSAKEAISSAKASKSNVIAPSILTANDVLKIYTMLFYKEKTQTAIALSYGVHQSTISDIWRQRRWKWITAPLRYMLETQGSDNG